MSKMRLRSLPCLVPSLLGLFSLFLTLSIPANVGYAAENNAASFSAEGRLVIVGGALRASNEAIYRSFLQGASDDAPIAVVPLASGVPEESGPLSVADIQQYAANPERVFDTQLTNNNPEKALVPALADTLAKSAAIWFTGGDQSRIVAALRPESGDTLCYDAVRKVLINGGTVGGSSAGAAMMSDPMIRSGESETAMLLGATDQVDGPGVCVGPGMGLFPYGLSDQHFLQRGRFGRLLVAMEATDNRLGFGVSENSALVVDLKSGLLTGIGNRGVTIIDRHASSKDGFARSNLRVHLLGSGDTYDAQTFQVAASPDKALITSDAPSVDPDKPREVTSVVIEDIWGRNVLPKIITTLITDPTSPVVGNDESFDYRFTVDGETKFYRKDGEELESTCVANLRLDITARPDVESRIERAKSRSRRDTSQ